MITIVHTKMSGTVLSLCKKQQVWHLKAQDVMDALSQGLTVNILLTIVFDVL